jgi:GPN-loop GTPase
MQRLNAHLHSQRTPPYVVNLDPAVRTVPFTANIDIRDSVNYKEVMSQYRLGPNGGILTSLNLFATKIDQIMGLLEKRATPDPAKPNTKLIEHILIDTPGQIEVFVWSASGAILLDALAASFPVVVAYVIDTPRSASTSTFMSNMLYACSILYKTKLPMILVCNKIDVQDADFVKEWMTDFEAFQAALRDEEERGSFGGFEGGGSGYLGSLLNSMSLVLDEFYRHLSVVPVSAVTGQGVDDFFKAVSDKAEEYERDYRPELERRRAARSEDKEKKRQKDLGKLMKDMNVQDTETGESAKGKARSKDPQPGSLSDMEDDLDEDEDDDDEDDEEEHDDNEGLEARYKAALHHEANAAGDPKADESLRRYLARSNIG